MATLTALAASNGGSDEREHAINKTRKVDDPTVANTSCLGRGNPMERLEKRVAVLEQKVGPEVSRRALTRNRSQAKAFNAYRRN